MNDGALDGKVVAVIGRGDDLHRAVAVACAEAGAAVALATVHRTRDQEYGVNSIANEVWALGNQHFVELMDADDPSAVVSFADEVLDRMKRCDVLVATHDEVTATPADVLSDDSWNESLDVNLSEPFFAAQAFGRLMAREGGGLVILTAPERDDADAAYAAAKAGLRAAAAKLEEAWHGRNVHLAWLATADAAEAGAAAVHLAVNPRH